MARKRFRFIPRDEGFYELFVGQAEHIEKAAVQFLDIVSDFTDVPKKASRLHDLEHEGDEITHRIMRRLNTTFVTPIDHEDIHRLASALDDVLDHIDAAADLLVLHKIEKPLKEMIAQAEVIVETAKTTREALQQLPKYDKLENYWVEINRLENDGDKIYRQAVADLFSGNRKALEVLKAKGVIDELEAAIDQMEDVANLLESLALKQG